MSNTPTPETDAMVAADLHHLEDDETCPASAYWRMAELTRTLERERDEARDELQDWKEAAASAENPHPDEAHCTCVPLLTASLKQARDKHARSIIEWGKEIAEAREETEQRDRLVEVCSAVVTRYPTGCFGIDYNGSMFHWWGFKETEVHAELERLRIPAKRVKWEERYYDRRYDFNDPLSYKTRPFIPHNVQGHAAAGGTPESIK
jgi:hypothetical protein